MRTETDVEPGVAATIEAGPASEWHAGSPWHRFRRSRSAVVALAVLAVLFILALLAPLLPLRDPVAIPSGSGRLPPSGEHWFGTDQLGRDLLSRVVHGARTSLVTGLLASALATVIAVVVGTAAGWRQRWTDNVLMRTTDVFLAFPALLLAGALVVALGRGTTTVIIVLGLVTWPAIARVCRAAVIEAKQAGFVEGARAIGSPELRIVIRHVLPHALPPVIVLSVLTVATTILAEAALSFLGVGVTDPTPSWGLMIAQGQRFLATSPHLVLFPAGAIALTVVCVVLISDGLQKAMHRHE